MTRRTLATGAIWSVPILVVGVAAPAFAASTTTRVVGTVTATDGPTNKSVQLTVNVAPLDGRTYTLRILTITNTVGNGTLWTLPDDTVFSSSPVPSVVVLKNNAGNPTVTWTATYQILDGSTVITQSSFSFVY